MLSPQATSLEVVRGFKQRGLKVIAYGDGIHSLPLRVRCLPLIAGAIDVLDSATPGFESALESILSATLRREAAARTEEQGVQRAMEDLGIVAQSAEMLSILRTILRISRFSDLPVLLSGETGTGKEKLARAIHLLDPKRRERPFVAVNCGAISPALAESELFGHRRGAFTGAERSRKGLIRAADGGGLFFDEIGELEAGLQAKRVLQEDRVLGVGEDEEVAVDTRVLAATNRDLAQMMATGNFRADLLHRLNVFPIHIPPLRERLADLKPLVAHFVHKHGSLCPVGIPVVADDFIAALSGITLSGNARELENLVRQALVRNQGGQPLSLCDLSQEVWTELSEGEWAERSTNSLAEAAPPVDFTLAGLLEANAGSLSQCLAVCEKLFVEIALRRSRGNQSQAARMLGVTSRSVYNKLRKHRLRAQR